MMTLNDIIDRWKPKRKRSSVKADFKAFLRQTNCKSHEVYDKDDKSTRYYFDYQGGHFVADIKGNDRGVDIIYPGIADMPIDELSLVRTLCNHYNSSNTLIKFTYTTSEEDNRVHVHMSFYANTVWPDELVDNLAAFFYFQRQFTDEYKALKQTAGENQSDDVECDHQRLVRERYIQFRQEMTHNSDSTTLEPDNNTRHLVLDELLRHILGVNAAPMRVEVTHAGKVETIEAPFAAKLDVLGHLIEGEGEQTHFVGTQVTMMVQLGDPQPQRLVAVVVNGEGEDQTTLYARVTAMMVPEPPSRTRSVGSEPLVPQSATIAVAVAKSTDEQRRAEYDYMLKDAQIKQRDGESLDELQQLIVDVANANIGYNLYWGRKLMLDRHFYQALLHLENAFNAMRTYYLDMGQGMRDTFIELCYCIGFCYTELRLFRDAYYYLDYVRDDGNIRHTSELINAMANGKDFRLFALTDDIAQAIRNRYERDEDIPDNLHSFINFMRRRRAYALIDHHQLDEAEKAFTSMLDDPDNSDYALNELAYIKRLRQANEE